MSLSCYNYRRDLAVYSSGHVTARCHGTVMTCVLDKSELEWYSEFETPFAGYNPQYQDNIINSSGIDQTVYQVSFERNANSAVSTVTVYHRDNYSVDDGPNSEKPYHTVGDLITATCCLIKAFVEKACTAAFPPCQNLPLRCRARPQTPSYSPGMDLQCLVDMFSRNIREIHQARANSPSICKSHCQASTQPCSRAFIRLSTQPQNQNPCPSSCNRLPCRMMFQTCRQAPVQQAPVPQAPVQQAPVQQTPEQQSSVVSSQEPMVGVAYIDPNGKIDIQQTGGRPLNAMGQETLASMISNVMEQLSLGDLMRKPYECPSTNQADTRDSTTTQNDVPVMENSSSQTDISHPSHDEMMELFDTLVETNPVVQGNVVITDVPSE
jgi:hypothetical protein